MTIIELHKKFPSQKDALRHLENVRWPEGKVICPFCQSNRITKMKSELRYHCNKENRTFSVRAKTIFEDSRLDIRSWFFAVALMLNAKKGISANQLKRDLGITYKTAWYCLMRIRCALADQVNFLQGIVQIDEAFLGGKPQKDNFGTTIQKSKRGRGTLKNKILVMVEQKKGGKSIAKLMPNLTSETLLTALKKYIKKDLSILVTDKYKGYSKLDDYFNHITINHSKQFSKDKISINKAENFIGLLKTGLVGQYHKLSAKYLPFYLSEFTFRYNNSLDKNSFSKAIELSVNKGKCMLRYKCNTNNHVEICQL